MTTTMTTIKLPLMKKDDVVKCPEIKFLIAAITENVVEESLEITDELLIDFEELKEPFFDDLEELFRVMVSKSLGYRVVANYDTYLSELLSELDDLSEVEVVTASNWTEWIQEGEPLPKILKPPEYQSDCEATFYIKDGLFMDGVPLDNFLSAVEEMVSQGVSEGLQELGPIEKATVKEDGSVYLLRNILANRINNIISLFNSAKNLTLSISESIAKRFVAFGSDNIIECDQGDCAEEHCVYEGRCVPRIYFADHTELGLEIPIGEAMELMWNHIIELLDTMDQYMEEVATLSMMEVEYAAEVEVCDCDCCGCCRHEDGDCDGWESKTAEEIEEEALYCCPYDDTLEGATANILQPGGPYGGDTSILLLTCPDEEDELCGLLAGEEDDFECECSCKYTDESGEVIEVLGNCFLLNCDYFEVVEQYSDILEQRALVGAIADEIKLLTAGFFKDPVNFEGYTKIEEHPFMADVCDPLNADIRTEDEISHCATSGNSKLIFREEQIRRKLDKSRSMFNECAEQESGATYIFSPIAEELNRTKMTKARKDGDGVYWTTSDFNWFCFYID